MTAPLMWVSCCLLLDPQLLRFSYSLTSLTSPACYIGEAGLHLSFSYIAVILPSNNSRVEVSLQSHLNLCSFLPISLVRRHILAKR